MTTAKGTILHNNWDEKPYHESPPQKATMAAIECVFHGDIEAKATTRYLMQYPTAETCHYSGYLNIVGTLGGKTGGFIIYEIGDWTGGVARSRWEIVKGSGTGELAGITGSGSYAAEKDKSVHYSLDYRL